MKRLIRFCQGLFGIKMNQTELGRTDIVYHNAIKDRVTQHHELKSALGRLIILRNRGEARTKTLNGDLAIIKKALTKAAQDNDESRGIELLTKRNQVQASIETSLVETKGFTQHIESTKQGLHKLSESIVHLKTEQAKIDARRKHAQARLQAAEALQNQEITDFDETALGRVRDAVEELEARAGLIEEPTDKLQETLSITALRKEQDQAQARDEFRAMQSKESGRLLVAPDFKSTLGMQIHEAHS